MTIEDYITEIEDLYLYVQLDPHLNLFSTMPTPASAITIHRNIRTGAASGEADAGSGQTGSYLCFRAS